jgi:5-methylcytosine-specific restriction protein A
METDRESLLKAMTRFDHDLRATKEWEGWEQNKAHKYAIDQDRTLYPVKQIVSIATTVPVREFSGGKGAGQANEIVERVGFDVISLHPTNPDWTRDEHILALDLYLKTRLKAPSKESAEINQLSQALNRLGVKLFARADRAETFRNPAGVYMKLMNFRRLDPNYTESGRVGLPRGAGGEEEVWAEFSNDPARCASVAAAILSSIDSEEVSSAFSDPDVDDGLQEAAEGRLLTRRHVVRERNRKLVASKLRSVLKAKGKLLCEVCQFDFELKYGTRGQGFIECHHTKPVTSLAEGGKTHINDLALVCPNCHRMIHRARPWLSLDELRALIGS